MAIVICEPQMASLAGTKLSNYTKRRQTAEMSSLLLQAEPRTIAITRQLLVLMH